MEGNNRSITISAACNVTIKSDVASVAIDGARFNHLRKKLADCVQWRIRSCRAVWTTLDPASTIRVGLLMTPYNTSFKPGDGDYLDLIERGGVGKLARQSNWGSNTLGSMDSFVDSSGIGAMLWVRFINPPTTAVDLGMINITLTLQMVGHK